jgi:hypothetical protein
MSSRELSLQGYKKAPPGVFDTSAQIVNKGAQVANAVTPRFAKRGLTNAKRVGEWGVNLFANSKLGQWAADKTYELGKKVRTGAAYSFNALPGGAVKTIGDLGKYDKISQVMIIIIGFLFFVLFWWSFNKMDLDKSNCTKLDKVYKAFPLISNINPENPTYKDTRLRDFYIKTAYNCCSGGSYKNDYVNLCALKSCIKQGARCLDFEIYSVNNLPVIAVSTVTDFNIKESYNSVPFAKAMEVISIYAFSGGNCPNPNDPLILNFRIKSNIKSIHDAMAKALYNTLGERLLGKQFSYETTGKNIGSYLISKLMGKIVVIVDKSNPLFTSSLLNEYVNIASNSAFIRLLRYREVEFTHDKDELIFYNQQNMTIVLPELSGDNTNFSAALAQTYGCQMIAMSFQNFDNNMQYYTKFFDDAGSAFVLRDDMYRYKPVFIPAPIPQKKCNTFAFKTTNPLGANGPASLNMQILPDCTDKDYIEGTTADSDATTTKSTSGSGSPPV